MNARAAAELEAAFAGTGAAAGTGADAAPAEVDISVILVNYNTARLLERCIGELRAASRGLRVQVVFVDNASADGSPELIRERFPDCLLIESGGNLGFGRANNLALPHCTGRHLLLLNTDAFVDAGALREALRHIDAHADVGVVGAQLSGSDGELQPACRRFPTPLNSFLQQTGLVRFAPDALAIDPARWQPQELAECDWVPGCFMLIRRELVERLGLFDPRFFMYCEEVDLCRRIRKAGWKVVYLPSARAVHLGGESAKGSGELTRRGRQISALQVESELLYFRKHHGRAGVAQWLALSGLAAVLLSAKDALKGRGVPAAASHWRQARAVWQGARRTRFGSRPTR